MSEKRLEKMVTVVREDMTYDVNYVGDLVQKLTNAQAQVPEPYRQQALVEMVCEDDDPILHIYYRRPETDEEFAERQQKVERLRQQRVQRLERELEQLKGE